MRNSAKAAIAYDYSAAERLTLALDGEWNSVKREGKALCPYHDDNDPSLVIKAGNKRDIIAYCHAGCGSVFERLVADGYVEQLSSSPTSAPKPTPSKAETILEEQLRFRDAFNILRAAVANGEEMPTAYLANRGIEYCPQQAGIVPIKEAKRLLSSRLDREGNRVLPKNAPVMVFPIIGIVGDDWAVQGAHTTVLNVEGTAKLNDNCRRYHGIKKGGFIPLWQGDLDPDAPLLVGEGIETTLSAMILADHYYGVSALDAGNFASVILPPCAEIVIARDRGKVGREAAKRLAQRYAAYMPVRIAVPPKGYDDWNDAHVAALKGDIDLVKLKRAIVKAALFDGVGDESSG